MRIDTNVMKPKLTMTNTPPCKHDKLRFLDSIAVNGYDGVRVLILLQCEHCGEIKEHRTWC